MSRTTYTLPRKLPVQIFSQVKTASVRVVWLNPSQYFYDVRAAGSTPPDTATYETWTRLDTEEIKFNYNDFVDIYMYAECENGRVIADTDGGVTNVAT